MAASGGHWKSGHFVAAGGISQTAKNKAANVAQQRLGDLQKKLTRYDASIENLRQSVNRGESWNEPQLMRMISTRESARRLLPDLQREAEVYTRRAR